MLIYFDKKLIVWLCRSGEDSPQSSASLYTMLSSILRILVTAIIFQREQEIRVCSHYTSHINPLLSSERCTVHKCVVIINHYFQNVLTYMYVLNACCSSPVAEERALSHRYSKRRTGKINNSA